MDRSRHCTEHAKRAQRYGGATAVPLRYRKEIGPRFHTWATEGFNRYANHAATAAALKLTDGLLNYQPTHDFSYQRKLANWLEHLRHGGVTARDVLIRVTELCAFIDANPGRLRSQREEDFALARNVLYLTPHSLSSRPEGARILSALGPLVREACYPFALGLARRLRRDTEERAALVKASGDFS